MTCPPVAGVSSAATVFAGPSIRSPVLESRSSPKPSAPTGTSSSTARWTRARRPHHGPIFTRTYTVFEITSDRERLHRAAAYVNSGLATGSFLPGIDKVFSLEDVVEAHRYMESSTQVGKIV
ncbi:zinc-binding dehydrogenase [Streptomyces sp. RK31]|uniref:zinc-binding dehydrogenase n=1 Tax=Streptomyces sp. RK31 TaxID=2824892 RepID=UPI001FFCC067|nr:zinc-binding dehydrogenase [Streptomyces sp. RK31]